MAAEVNMDELRCGDCIQLMARLPKGSVDLVFGSPPYEDARTYGIGFNLKGQDWVDWMVRVYRASLRVSKGLVAYVVEGKTRQFRWSATPALLMADLHRAGVHLRKPPAFHRVGIPGSGGPDWLRNDYEFVVCATNGGQLPWSDNTVMGGFPKYNTGGRPTSRKRNGTRMDRDTNPSTWGIYTEETRVNPGNLLSYPVGGGIMGNKLCHQNEAPFPEALVEFFIRSFCPPGGLVLDPFCGSGTTCAVAKRWGRHWIGFDVRQSQIDLTTRRLTEVEVSHAV